MHSTPYRQHASICAQHNTKVIKFGGSSLADADKIIQVAKIIIAHAATTRTHVVLSAMAGVTNKLQQLLAEPYLPTQQVQAEHITQQHLRAVDALAAKLPELATPALKREVVDLGTLLQADITQLNAADEAQQQTEIRILTVGERWSCTLLTAVLHALQQDAARLAAKDVMAVQETLGLDKSCLPDLARTKQRYQRLVEHGPSAGSSILVTEGFYGCTDDGKLGCFGRNGSDLSAAVLAIAADADDLSIWSDVDGVYCADPNLVPTAKTIQQLSIAELYRFAHLGASVIYAPTLSYLDQHKLPLRLKNTFAPEQPGTLVTVKDQDNDFFGIGAIEKITVEHTDGFLTFNACEKSGCTARYLFAKTRAECADLLQHDACPEAMETPLSLLTVVSNSINKLTPAIVATLKNSSQPIYQIIEKPIARALAFVVPPSSLAASMQLLHQLLSENIDALLRTEP